MSATPKVTNPYINQGGVEAMLSSEGSGIPITIDGTRNTGLVKGPSLYARKSASPYQAKPFMNGTLVINPTNTTNATVDIADADAGKFRVGDTVTYYDVSAGGLYTGAGKVISAIGAAGSGGTGETLVTLTGVWTTAPDAGDWLCVADGTELSANVVVVLNDITFDGVTNFNETGYISGVYKKSLVGNTTRFDNTKAPTIQLVDIV